MLDGQATARSTPQLHLCGNVRSSTTEPATGTYAGGPELIVCFHRVQLNLRIQIAMPVTVSLIFTVTVQTLPQVYVSVPRRLRWL